MWTPAKGRKLLYADSPETKILKSGREKPYGAVLLSKQLKVLIKEMLEFIIQKVDVLLLLLIPNNNIESSECYEDGHFKQCFIFLFLITTTKIHLKIRYFKETWIGNTI